MSDERCFHARKAFITGRRRWTVRCFSFRLWLGILLLLQIAVPKAGRGEPRGVRLSYGSSNGLATEITVSWNTDESCDCLVQYGTDSTVLDREATGQTSATPILEVGYAHEVTLQGLAPPDPLLLPGGGREPRLQPDLLLSHRHRRSLSALHLHRRGGHALRQRLRAERVLAPDPGRVPAARSPVRAGKR